MKTKRPFLIWILSIVFLALAARSLLQVIQAIHSWNLLIALQYRLTPLYPVFQGAFLCGCFVTAAVLIFCRVSWAPTFNALTVLTASLWSWIDRLFLSLNPRPFSEQIFALIATLAFLGLVLLSLWSLQPFMHDRHAPLGNISVEMSSSGGNHEP